MGPGARTPEELESLLEDAFLLRDRLALAQLFGDGAVLAAPEERQPVVTEAIDRVAVQLWDSGRLFVADPRHVIQARDTALVVSDSSVNVLHRGADRLWRYAIAALSFDGGLNRGFTP